VLVHPVPELGVLHRRPAARLVVSAAIVTVRESKIRWTSRTWQAYSSADQVVGIGRLAAPGAASASTRSPALATIASGSRSLLTPVASNPQSAHTWSRTQVQSFVSGSMVSEVTGPSSPHRSAESHSIE
jgi:hypothetical protein